MQTILVDAHLSCRATGDKRRSERARIDRSGDRLTQNLLDSRRLWEHCLSVRRTRPMTKTFLFAGFLTVAIAGALAVSLAPLAGQQPRQAGPAVPTDNADIGGDVTCRNGPEAGGWVIAQR